MSTLQRLGVKTGLTKNPLKDSVLAVAYSYLGGPIQTYLNAFKTEMVKTYLRDKNVYLFVKNVKGLDVSGLPSSIHVIPYNAMGFSTHEALMAHSNLPILITGNVSASQALQFGKAFIMDYSSPSHVTGGPKLFFDKLTQQSPYLKQGNRASLFTASDRIASLHSAPLSEQIQYGPPISVVAQAISDPQFSTELEGALDATRSQLSLPLKVAEMLVILDELGPAEIAKDLMIVAKALDARNPLISTQEKEPRFVSLAQKAKETCAALLRNPNR